MTVWYVRRGRRRKTFLSEPLVSFFSLRKTFWRGKDDNLDVNGASVLPFFLPWHLDLSHILLAYLSFFFSLMLTKEKERKRERGGNKSNFRRSERKEKGEKI